MKSDRARKLPAVQPWRALVTSAFMLTAPLVAFGGTTALVPSGSSDALSDAIAFAGPHGTVVLKTVFTRNQLLAGVVRKLITQRCAVTSRRS